MTQQLRDTFVAHEHLAPDADLALEAIQHRITSRRRSRIAVAGTVLTVAAVSAAISIPLLGHGRATHSGHPPATSGVGNPSEFYLTFAATWLPSGAVHSTPTSWRSQGTGGLRYDVDDGSSGYAISVSTDTRQPSEKSIMTGTWNTKVTSHGRAKWIEFTVPPESVHQTTIGGRPAWEAGTAHHCEVAFSLPSGLSGNVSLTTAQDLSATDPAVLCRKVAAGVEEGQHNPIHVPLKLGYLPPGYAMTDITPANGFQFDATPASGTGPELQIGQDMGEPHQRPQVASPGPLGDYVTHGRPVQGHDTYEDVSKDIKGGRALIVYDFRPGVTVMLSGGLDLNELYRVADQMHWQS